MDSSTHDGHNYDHILKGAFTREKEYSQYFQNMEKISIHISST